MHSAPKLLGGIANGRDVPHGWEGVCVWEEVGTDRRSLYSKRHFIHGAARIDVWVHVEVPEEAFVMVMWWHQESYRGDLVAAQKEMLHETFKSAANYTNVILVAGYAALFALWVQMKGFETGQFTALTSFMSAIFMVISVAAFLANEIFGMFMRTRAMLSIAKIVDAPTDFFERIQAYQVRTAEIARQTGPFWTFMVGFAVANAVIAAGIMLAALLHGAWKALC